MEPLSKRLVTYYKISSQNVKNVWPWKYYTNLFKVGLTDQLDDHFDIIPLQTGPSKGKIVDSSVEDNWLLGGMIVDSLGNWLLTPWGIDCWLLGVDCCRLGISSLLFRAVGRGAAWRHVPHLNLSPTVLSHATSAPSTLLCAAPISKSYLRHCSFSRASTMLPTVWIRQIICLIPVTRAQIRDQPSVVRIWQIICLRLCLIQRMGN